jgi:hypothetical protein
MYIGVPAITPLREMLVMLLQLDPRAAAAVLDALLAAGGLDEDAPHGLGGGREEVAAMVPPVAVGRADQPELRFVDQGGRLEGVAGRFGCQSGGGELAQLVVDEREELGDGVALPASHARQDTRHLAHGRLRECRRARPSATPPHPFAGFERDGVRRRADPVEPRLRSLPTEAIDECINFGRTGLRQGRYVRR